MKMQDVKLGMKIKIIGCEQQNKCKSCSRGNCSGKYAIGVITAIENMYSVTVRCGKSGLRSKFLFNIEACNNRIDRMLAI